jgi:hypothetical protein
MEALAAPTDTAALDARLAQEALRVRRECIKDQQALLAAERERCAKVCDDVDNEYENGQAYVCKDRIREMK